MGLLQDVLKLPHAFAIANVVWHRCGIDAAQAALITKQIIIVDLPPECFQEAVDLRVRFPALSAEEAFSFSIGRTRRLKCLVLADPINRRVAEAEGLSYRDSLWLLQQLLEQRWLDSARMRECRDRCGQIRGLVDAEQLLESYLRKAGRRRGA